MNILFTTSLLLFTLITIYKTRLGIYLILILVPSFLIRTQIFSIPTTFLELSIYILTAIWLLKKTISYNCVTRSLPKGDELITTSYKNLIQHAKPFLIPITLFILAALISTAISPDKRLSLGILKAWILDPLLFTIIFIDQIKTREHVNKVIASLSLMVLWVSAYGIYEYFVNPRNLIEYLRLDSIFTSANYVTMLTVPVTLIIISYLISTLKQYNNITIEQKNNETKKQLKFSSFCFLVFLFSCFLVSTTAIYLTKSFSGWLGLSAGIFILLLLTPIKRKIKIITICSLLVLGGLFAYTQKDNPKFQALTNFTGRTAVHSRIQIWKTSVEIIKDNPVLGIGLGNFHNAYLKYLPKTIKSPLEQEVIKPHNLYLNLWLEMGLLGLVAFLWLIVVFYKKGLGIKYQVLRATVFAAMTALLIQGFFDTPYFKNDLSLIFWLIIGLSIIRVDPSNPLNPCSKLNTDDTD
ncbi:O-antigen ligase family protein [Patescibacteria group bacterium]|nr:O-antigen ligase family protein [Patescibacteria group bacterium]